MFTTSWLQQITNLHSFWGTRKSIHRSFAWSWNLLVSMFKSLWARCLTSMLPHQYTNLCEWFSFQKSILWQFLCYCTRESLESRFALLKSLQACLEECILPRAFRYDRTFWLLIALVACLSQIKMCVRRSGTQTVRNATWAPFIAELSGTLNVQRCLPDPLCLHDTQTASPLAAGCWNKTSSHANSSTQRQQSSFPMGCFTDRTHWSTFFYISGG